MTLDGRLCPILRHSRTTAAGASAGSSSNCLSRRMIWSAISTATKWPPGTEMRLAVGSVRAIVQAIDGRDDVVGKPVPQRDSLIRRQVPDREPVMPVNRQFLRQGLRALPFGENLVEVFHEQVIDLLTLKGLAVGERPRRDQAVQESVGISSETVHGFLKEPHRQVRVPRADLEHHAPAPVHLWKALRAAASGPCR